MARSRTLLGPEQYVVYVIRRNFYVVLINNVHTLIENLTMAKLVQEKIVITASIAVPESSTLSNIIDTETIENLGAVAKELLGQNVVVEIEKINENN